MRWKLAALSAFAILLLAMLLWRQEKQLALTRAVNSAHVATIQVLTRERSARDKAVESMTREKDAVVHKLTRDRQQVAEAVRHDEVVASWHDSLLPHAVLGVLGTSADSDSTPDAPGHAHAGD